MTMQLKMFRLPLMQWKFLLLLLLNLQRLQTQGLLLQNLNLQLV